MSVVIAYVSDNNINNISVIITDTMVCNKDNSFNRNSQKLFENKLGGWYAGTGAFGFVDSLSKKLNNTKINNTDDITDIYKQLVKESINGGLQPYSNADIYCTKIIFSYNVQDKETGLTAIRLGYLGNNERLLSKPNNLHILLPGDYKNNIDYINKLLEETYYEFNGDIMKLLHKLINIFKHISDNSKVVSNTCHIGITFQNDMRRGYIKGSSDKLLSDIENNGDLTYDDYL